MDEMEEIGYEDYFYGQGLSVVEWGNLVLEILPSHCMEIKIENNLSANEYNNLRSKIGWDTKDIEVVQNAIKNTKGKNHSYFNFYSN